MTDQRAQVAGHVRALAAWAAATQPADLPAAVLRRAAIVIGDDIAAMVAARSEPEVVGVRDQLIRHSRAPEATVFDGAGSRADRSSAAVANAIAGNWAELDEGYRVAPCHAGLYAVPAALAEAEAAARSVGDVLAAVAVAYEVAARLARAWTFPPVTVHPHAVFAPVGAAAAVAHLRGVSRETFLAALTASSTLTMVGPYNHAIQGALVRNVWAGVGAWSGIHSVDWASSGISGDPGSPHDVYTIALGGRVAPEVLTTQLGEWWAISDGYHKLFACCQYGHSAVEAVLMLLERLPEGVRPADVDEVVVETHRLGLSLENSEPATTLASKFSMQHIVASTLLTGSAGSDAFTSVMLTRPDVVALRAKVRLQPFEPELPPPNDRPSRVTVRFTNGALRTAECLSARGGPDRPLSEEVVLDKISGLVEGVYPGFVSALTRLLEDPMGGCSESWREFVGRLTGAGASSAGGLT